ncbi:MAG: hypothetical protein IKR48_10115 [Kiritimatiellae bacterium]|nr:hypothetical protein [Kiritimatiellia bacterium]
MAKKQLAVAPKKHYTKKHSFSTEAALVDAVREERLQQVGYERRLAESFG